MKQMLLLLLIGYVVGRFEILAAAAEKPLNCSDLASDYFDVNKTLGTWYITNKSPKGHFCVEFSIVSAEDRKNFTQQLDKYVKGLNWARYTLKVDMPCRQEFTNDSQIHVLENVNDKGLYRSFVIPEDREKIDNIDPYTVLLKLVTIKGKEYLAFLGCDYRFSLLFSRDRMEKFEQSWIKEVRDKLNITAEFN